MNDAKFKLERVQGAQVGDQEILADMKRAAQAAGTEILSQRLYSEYGQFDPTTASKRFGSWNSAIAAAGLHPANEVNISDDRLFENLMTLWQHYGRQPRRSQLSRAPSCFSQSAYKRRFGSWGNALREFVAFANAQDARPPSIVETASGRKTGRDPSLRMRFRVMTRDGFKCRACGASPALTPGVRLHVDHIRAWSLGGETFDDNLQTLCEPCNLGKSNSF